jgi:DNA-directed RNA polymerase specialized sigma subunit
MINGMFKYANDYKQPTEIPAWQRYQMGDKKAASQFLMDVDKTISQAINSYASGDLAYKTQARILALQAVESFDPNKGANINTHVFNALKRLQRIAAQRGNLTHVPEVAATQRAAVMRARKDYEIDNGVEPTVEELATMTGISRKRINDLANYMPVAPDSLTVSPEGDSLVASREQHALDLYDAYTYDELDRIDKKIYEWSTGYGGAKKISQVEMANKLGITPAAVNKRYKNISLKYNRDREIVRRAIINA